MTTTQKTEFALLDSGATENFIDPRTMEQLRLPIRKLAYPRIIYNIDGTLNKAGSITHVCPIKLQIGDQIQEMNFYVTDLGQDRIILGFPFLQKFNPKINWEEKILDPPQRIFMTPKHLWEHRWKVWKQDHYRLPKELLRKVTFAQQWAAKEQKQRLKEDEVPIEYQCHSQVFSEEGAKRLPPSREEDMAIELKETAPEQLDCKVYPLSTKELDVLRQSLKEDIAKGYI